MSALLAVLLAASFDGQAALGHASSLAPLGSPRNQAAAAYVAAQLREAGLDAVELAPFESHGVQGTNVIGTLRAPGDELVVIGAHHDTVAEAPGAYDDEESEATGKGSAVGSRAFIERLGPRARSLVAAFAVDMSGWRGGTPSL